MIDIATELLSPDFIARLDQLSLVSRKMFAGKMHGERLTKRRGLWSDSLVSASDRKPLPRPSLCICRASGTTLPPWSPLGNIVGMARP